VTTARIALSLIAYLGAQQPLGGQATAGIWLEVPFISQSEDGCGSASLAMLLQYWNAQGASISPEKAEAARIQKLLYAPKAHGIFASEMERYLREAGFREFAVRGEWSDLREHLEHGRPLIVSIQPGKARAPFHYVVVTGIDWLHEAVFLNDPARGKLLRVERREFEKQWQAVRNWMLLAVPAEAH
jgi:predicted double-glycine peptidase